MRPFMLNNSIRLIRPRSYQPLRPGQSGLGGISRYPIIFEKNCCCNSCHNYSWIDYRTNWEKNMDKTTDIIGLIGLGVNLLGEALSWFDKGDDNNGNV